MYYPAPSGACEIEDGADWLKIHPGTGFRYNPVEAPSRQTETYTDGVLTDAGEAGPGNCEFDFLPNEAMRYFEMLEDSGKNSTPVVIRNDAGGKASKLLEGVDAKVELAVAVVGDAKDQKVTITASGTDVRDKYFGTDAAPAGHWNQGLVLAFDGDEDVALVIDAVTGGKTLRGRVFGGIPADGVVKRDTAKVAEAIGATHVFRLIKPTHRFTYYGRIILPPGYETTGTERSASATLSTSRSRDLSLVLPAVA